MKDRRCPSCGCDPSLGLAPSPVEAVTPREETETNSQRKSGSHASRNKKHRHVMLKIIGFWLLLVGLIVLCINLLLDEKQSQCPPPTATLTATTATDEDLALLNEATPLCMAAFSGFLAAGIPEGGTQFVLSPVSAASRMARFYSLNPWTNLDPKTLNLATHSVINLPGGPAIEIFWNTQDGKKIDTVFRKENDEWRLDWDHFVRYSDSPWPLFLAGSDEPQGEFRLLARERLADERKHTSAISLVLYAPRFGHPEDTVSQSPEFLVSRNSKDGKLLDAAFKLARSGKQVFDSNLPNINPKEMIRVRVKIQRDEADMDRKFKITEVLACHWYAVDDPGVALPIPGAEQP